MTGLLAVALAVVALADSARPLPAEGRVVYGGVGGGAFQYGASGRIRDPQVRGRIDTFAARGLGQGWELRGGVPLVRAGAVEDPLRGPCPGEGDYCATTTGVGEAWVGLRRGLVDRGWQALVEVGAFGDPWNAGTRGRWTNIGLGTGGGAAALVVGVEGAAGETRIGAVGSARYRLVVGRAHPDSAVRLPADDASGALELWAQRGRWRPEVAVSSLGRLGGLDYGDAWVRTWRPQADRWAALRYREVVGRVKLSIDLAEGTGLHVSAGRVLAAWSGPRDATDVGVGVHRYWSARR